jgi:hypothetical protein
LIRKTWSLLQSLKPLSAGAGAPVDRKKPPPSAIPRYRSLYEALTSKTMEVRVLPDSAFGLIHGKAGVVRRADGSATAFLGSVNESAPAWKVNYELLWEDNDPETVAWVQEEFEALWNDARAVDLACCPFIAQDVQRIISRKVIEPEELKAIAAAAASRTSTAGSERLQKLHGCRNGITTPLPRTAPARRQWRSQAGNDDRLS